MVLLHKYKERLFPFLLICGRNSDKEFSRFLDIALGSAFELFTLITLSVELNFIDKIESESILHEISEIQKMIYGLKQKLNNK